MDTGDTGESNEVFHLERGIPVFNARLTEVEQKQAQSETREGQYKKEQLRIDRRIMYFTGALVACSLLSAVVSGYQAYVASISAKAARSAANTAEGTLTVTKQMATAEEKSLGATVEQFHLDQRAWVGMIQAAVSIKTGEKARFETAI